MLWLSILCFLWGGRVWVEVLLVSCLAIDCSTFKVHPAYVRSHSGVPQEGVPGRWVRQWVTSCEWTQSLSNPVLELIFFFIINLKFIVVHVRRGDFAYRYSTDRSNPDCFPPLSMYKKHVDDIVVEIQSSHDIDPHALQVLVMSGNYICLNLFLFVFTYRYFFFHFKSVRRKFSWFLGGSAKRGLVLY